jgi:hypothetical protein
VLVVALTAGIAAPAVAGAEESLAAIAAPPSGWSGPPATTRDPSAWLHARPGAEDLQWVEALAGGWRGSDGTILVTAVRFADEQTARDMWVALSRAPGKGWEFTRDVGPYGTFAASAPLSDPVVGGGVNPSYRVHELYRLRGRDVVIYGGSGRAGAPSQHLLDAAAAHAAVYPTVGDLPTLPQPGRPWPAAILVVGLVAVAAVLLRQRSRRRVPPALPVPLPMTLGWTSHAPAAQGGGAPQ